MKSCVGEGGAFRSEESFQAATSACDMARNTVGTGTGADVSISCLPDFDSFMFVSWHGLGVKGRICCVQCLVFATYVLSPEIIVFFFVFAVLSLAIRFKFSEYIIFLWLLLRYGH